MNSEDYKIIRTCQLDDAFQILVKDLRQKYDIKFEISTNYDTLLISGSADIDNVIDNIRNDIIKFAKESLDEDYKIILPMPAYTSFSPHTRINATRTYSLSRVLKVDEPK